MYIFSRAEPNIFVTIISKTKVEAVSKWRNPAAVHFANKEVNKINEFLSVSIKILTFAYL